MENNENDGHKHEPEDVKFLDLFNPNSPRSDEDLIKDRLEICNACRIYAAKKNSNHCVSCGPLLKKLLKI